MFYTTRFSSIVACLLAAAVLGGAARAGSPGPYARTREWRITGLSSSTVKAGDILVIRGHFPLNGADGILSYNAFSAVMVHGTTVMHADDYGTLDVQSAGASFYKVKIPDRIRPGSQNIILVKWRYPQLVTNPYPVRLLPPSKPDIRVTSISAGWGREMVEERKGRITLHKNQYKLGPRGNVLIDVAVKLSEVNYKDTGLFQGRFLWCSPKKYGKWKPCAVQKKLFLPAGKKDKVVRCRIRVGYNHFKSDQANTCLMYRANWRKKPRELTYKNNKSEVMIYFADFACPDLAIVKMERLTKKPRKGKRVKVLVVVKNVGVKVSPRFKLKSRWTGSNSINTATFPSLAPGKSRKVLLSHVFSQKGKVRCSAGVEPIARVREYRIDNNGRNITFKVK